MELQKPSLITHCSKLSINFFLPGTFRWASHCLIFQLVWLLPHGRQLGRLRWRSGTGPEGRSTERCPPAAREAPLVGHWTPSSLVWGAELCLWSGLHEGFECWQTRPVGRRLCQFVAKRERFVKGVLIR